MDDDGKEQLRKYETIGKKVMHDNLDDENKKLFKKRGQQKKKGKLR